MRPKIPTVDCIMIAMTVVTWVWAGWGWAASPRRIHAVEARCSADTGRHWDSGSGEVMMIIININSKITMALIMPIMMMIHDADESCYNAQLTVTAANLWTLCEDNNMDSSFTESLTPAKGSQGVESIFGHMYYLVEGANIALYLEKI